MFNSRNAETLNCGECAFYSPNGSEKTGTCGLYCSVNEDLQRVFWKKVDSDDSCRYGLRSEQSLEMTPQGILQVLRQVPDTFWDAPDLSDINIPKLEAALSSAK